MGNVRFKPGRQNNFAESEITFWRSMNRNMYWFHMGDIRSEPGRQNNSAESEIKFWVSIDKMY